MPDYKRKPGPRSADWNYGGTKWKLSRSKLDLFMECKLCFYLDNRLGVSRPRGPAFTLNIAVDELLKREFDIHRVDKSPHPLMSAYGLSTIVPYNGKQLSEWRDNFTGVQYHDPETGLTVSGAVDDIWINSDGELIVVDYKATSKEGKIESLSDSGWDAQYKRQMEVYQWILRRNGYKVASKGYFVYVNGRKDRKAFDARLEFDVTLLSHVGDDSWVHKAIAEAKACLESDKPPLPSPGCDFCSYRKSARDVQAEAKKSTKTLL